MRFLATTVFVVGMLLAFGFLAAFWFSMLDMENRVLTDSGTGADGEYRDTGEDAGDKEVYEGTDIGTSMGVGFVEHGNVVDDTTAELRPVLVHGDDDRGGAVDDGGAAEVGAPGPTSDAGNHAVDVDMGISKPVARVGGIR